LRFDEIIELQIYSMESIYTVFQKLVHQADINKFVN